MGLTIVSLAQHLAFGNILQDCKYLIHKQLFFVFIQFLVFVLPTIDKKACYGPNSYVRVVITGQYLSQTMLLNDRSKATKS